MKSHPLSSPATLRATPRPPAPALPPVEEGIPFDLSTPAAPGSYTAEEVAAVAAVYFQVVAALVGLNAWAQAMHAELLKRGADFSQITPLGNEAVRLGSIATEGAEEIIPLLNRSNG
ncbi:MAG: hypothetical protein ABJF10_02085 [Chthoniobacter sp.]|uniref:hypothetical protein n=1 Tax=Chthoniobacter sp. TaxID=2510640 RepID=UPI0032A91B48